MAQQTIIAKNNIDARLAALFVQAASKFSSTIKINKSNKEANAKSIMGLISMAVLVGDEVTISTQGTDEAQALAEIAELL